MHTSAKTLLALLVGLVLAGGAVAPLESSTIRYRTDEELIAMSDRIVHARVLRQRTAQPDGEEGTIYTVTTLAVLEDLTGLPGHEIEVWELGGILGNRFTYVGGAVEYTVGSEVLVLLENGRRGLRSVSMGFSKFDLAPAADGDVRLIRNTRGTLVVGATAAIEERTLGQFRDLTSRVRGVRPVRNEAAYALQPAIEGTLPFATLNSLRWVQADSGTPVNWYKNTISSPPLFSGDAVSEIQTSLTAWTTPASASIILNYGGTVSEANAKGPWAVGENVGVISFEDPNNEISGNTLAIGGGSGFVGCGGTFNGRTWNCFTRGYVIFQNAANLGSSYRQSTDFARVMQHEIGHAIGLGHSDVGTSNIMYFQCCFPDTPMPGALGADDLDGVSFIYPSAAPSCSYSINPTSVSVGSGATSGTINVTATAGCSWTAASNNGFITIDSGSSGTGSGSVGFSIAANGSTSQRNGTATIAGQTFSVTQAGAQVCTYSINPASVSIGFAAADGNITVTTQAGCAWSASSSSGFITFTNGTGRTGSGTVRFDVAMNTGNGRQGTATVAGQAFTVNQGAPPPCSYAINPATVGIGNLEASGSITVTTDSWCSWSATSNNSFITFSNATGRTGSGALPFTVATNGSASSRQGTATIAGQAFTVNQGAAPVLRLAPDINNDGDYDLVWQNRFGGGYIAGWMMNGLNLADSALTNPSTISDPNWRVAATADMDGDGKMDLIFQEETQGWIGIWKMNGLNLVTSLAISIERVPDTDWKIVAAQDFNNDGKADLVWHHRTQGYIALWYMDGVTVVASELFSPGRVADTNWQIEAAADFNSDGKTDLVWRHQTEGWIVLWTMDGITLVSSRDLSPNRVSDTNWRIAAIGDVNRDNMPDLIWHDIVNGWIGVWLMNGHALASSIAFNPERVPDVNWRIVGPK